MKTKYLGFLPAIILILFSHYQVITGYIEWKNTNNIFAMNPICVAIVFLFWLVSSVVGVLMAIK